ncbi:hypothetical protein [Ponticaulis koreensis]|uniref:hypothetical protein n=1 Tax=Ponticaulis koreensis TaxID=1123045 RepID=UPI0003B6E153|nr:hypothetical protein [Ponticaulis koreensis]
MTSLSPFTPEYFEKLEAFVLNDLRREGMTFFDEAWPLMFEAIGDRHGDENVRIKKRSQHLWRAIGAMRRHDIPVPESYMQEALTANEEIERLPVFFALGNRDYEKAVAGLLAAQGKTIIERFKIDVGLFLKKKSERLYRNRGPKKDKSVKKGTKAFSELMPIFAFSDLTITRSTTRMFEVVHASGRSGARIEHDIDYLSEMYPQPTIFFYPTEGSRLGYQLHRLTMDLLPLSMHPLTLTLNGFSDEEKLHVRILQFYCTMRIPGIIARFLTEISSEGELNLPDV